MIDSVAIGTSAIDQWHNEIFEILASGNKKNVNIWLDDFEATFTNSQVRVNTYEGFAGYSVTNNFVGGSSDFEIYKRMYANRVKQLSTKTLTEARMLRNNLGVRMGGNYQKLADEFTQFSKSSLGLNQRTINKAFKQKAIFLETTGLMDSVGRVWTPDNYFKMYSRTRGSEMSDIIMADEMQSEGLDVVKITDVSTTTPICLEYEGRYFSRFGKTEGLPILDIFPPFHPNCRHTAVPVDVRTVSQSEMQRANRGVDARSKISNKEYTTKQKAGISRQKDWNLKNRSGIGTAENNKAVFEGAKKTTERLEQIA